MFKKFTVKTGTIGLVYKNGIFKRALTEGQYWLKSQETVSEYLFSGQFMPNVDINILLKDKMIAGLIEQVSVPDMHIALYYENNNFKRILEPGIHAFWKTETKRKFELADLSKIEITEKINPNILQKLPSNYVRIIKMNPSYKGLIYINGLLDKVLNEGVYYFWNNATPIVVISEDIRTQQLEISGQELLTKDKAAIRISFFIQYAVNDIVKALDKNKDFKQQLYVLIQLAMREFAGTLTLDEILEKKETVSEFVLDAVKSDADNLGVKITTAGVKDIILPGEIKTIMNQVLLATKQAQANIITRREETASMRSMLNTAKLMEENEMLFKLKEMEYIEKIADKINNLSLSGGGLVVEQLRELFSSGNPNTKQVSK